MPDQEPNANAEAQDTNPEDQGTVAVVQPEPKDKKTRPSEEYKGLQRKIAQLEKEIQEARAARSFDETNALLRELLSRTEGNQALTLDAIEASNTTDPDSFDGQAKSKYQHYQQYQLTEAQRKAAQQQADYNRRVANVQKELKELMKQDFEVDPESSEIQGVWNEEQTHPLEATLKLWKLITGKHKEVKAMNEETLAKLVKEGINKTLVDMGLLRADMTQGASGGMTRAGIQRVAEQVARENDPVKRRELLQKVDDAWKAGLIK